MAAHLGLTEEAYRALEKGRTIRLEWETILRLMDILDNSGLSVEWFFGRVPKAGTGDAPAAGSEAEPSPGAPQSKMRQALDRAAATLISEEAARPPLPTPVHKVPRPRRKRGFRSAESGLPLMDPGQVVRSVQPDGSVAPGVGVPRLKLTPPTAPDSIGVRVWGGSLPTGYQDGDVVVCNRGQPASGQPGLLVLKSRECLLAVWRTEASGRLRVNPLDADLPVRSLAPDDILVVFAVVRRIPRDQVAAPAK